MRGAGLLGKASEASAGPGLYLKCLCRKQHCMHQVSSLTGVVHLPTFFSQPSEKKHIPVFCLSSSLLKSRDKPLSPSLDVKKKKRPSSQRLYPNITDTGVELQFTVCAVRGWVVKYSSCPGPPLLLSSQACKWQIESNLIDLLCLLSAFLSWSQFSSLVLIFKHAEIIYKYIWSFAWLRENRFQQVERKP